MMPPPPGVPVVTHPRLGLALGSGSARGWAHIGILTALAERGLRPGVVAGASIGALVAAAHASGQLDSLEAWVRGLTQLDVWRLLDTTFRGGGVMTGHRLMHALGKHVIDRPIEELPVAFGAVCADLSTGEEVWLREGSMLDAVRASSGIPGLFTPVWHQDRWMIDGGVVNPVPVSLCRALGAEVVIAVNLNRSVGKVAEGAPPRAAAAPPPAPMTEQDSAETSALRHRWADLVSGLISTLRAAGRHDEPSMFEVMAGTLRIMQHEITLSRLAVHPPDLVLAPDLDHLQLMDFHRAAEAIEAGRATVAQAEEALAGLGSRAAG